MTNVGTVKGQQGDPGTGVGPTGVIGPTGRAGAAGVPGLGDSRVVRIIGSQGTNTGAYFIMDNGRVYYAGPTLGVFVATTADFYMANVVPFPNDLVFVDGAANGNVACFETNTGAVWCWGNNPHGQMGVAPTPAPTTGPFFGGVNARYAVQVPLPNNTVVTKLWITGAVGSEAILALTQAGQIYTWGFNGNFVLGNGVSSTTANPAPSLVQVSAGVNLDRVIDFSANSQDTSWAVALVNPNANFTGNPRRCVGANCDCNNGCDVFTWGANGAFQLGRITSNQGFATSIPIKARAISLQGGNSAGGSSCAILWSADPNIDFSAYCWGYNNEGQCGTGTASATMSIAQVVDTASVPFRTIQMVSNMGDTSSYRCGIRRGDGAIFCWGAANGFQGLGVGNTNNQPSATRVVGINGDVSWNVNFTQVILTPGRTTAQFWTAYGLRADGTVWGWGYNGERQYNGPNYVYATLTFATQVFGLQNIVQLAMIGSNTFTNTLFALQADMLNVWAIGNNGRRQVGDGSTLNHGYPRRVLGLGN